MAQRGTGRGGYGDRGGLLDEDFRGWVGGWLVAAGWFRVAAGDATHDDGFLPLEVRGGGRREGCGTGWVVKPCGQGHHRVAEIQLVGAFAGRGRAGVVADTAGAAILGLDHGGHAGG